jgi:hypothetical protein
MPHVMVIIDLFILVAIVWAFSENNRQLKLFSASCSANLRSRFFFSCFKS